MKFYSFILLLCLLYCSIAKDLSFPDVVTAQYKTIAHQVPESQEYPSRLKYYKLYYDRNYGAMRVETVNENGVKITFIRNYHDHYETRIESINGEDFCEYSYLGSSMPNPSFSSEIHFNKDQNSNGVNYRSYSYQNYRQYIDIYVNNDTDFPFRLDEFYIDEKNVPQPVFSTVYQSYDLNPIDPKIFDVLSLKENNKCIRNSKGWPYQYILGPFVKA